MASITTKTNGSVWYTMVENPTKGKVVVAQGAYYLEVPDAKKPRKKELIPLGATIDKQVIEPLVGKEVGLVYSEPKSFIVGILGEPDLEFGKPQWILCYIPVPWVRPIRPDRAIMQALTKEFVNNGTLSEANGERLLR